MKLKELRKRLEKQFFSIKDVKDAFGKEDPRYIRLQLSRFVKRGDLLRVRKGYYCFQTNKINKYWLGSEFVRSRNYYRKDIGKENNFAYLSLESVLTKIKLLDKKDVLWGINNGIRNRKQLRLNKSLPITYVTRDYHPPVFNSKIYYKYSQIKDDLFFGFKKVFLPNKKFYFEALPEKALLDYIYIRRPFGIDHLDFVSCSILSKKRIERFLRIFPKWLKHYDIWY